MRFLVVLGLCLALWTSFSSSHYQSLFALADCTTYEVKSGDTCNGICQAHNISLSDFLSWNPDINCDDLRIGDIVCISKPTSPSTPPPNFNGNIFREYIGAIYNGVNFSDVPISDAVKFHFILAFGLDYTPDAVPTDGVFNIFWQNAVLTPDGVKAIKAQNPNVKVMMSLGGDSISNQFAQFHPSSVSSWVSNAVSSLTSLIEQYHLDGIDIDYEHFDNDGVTPQLFASCTGKLIQQLKANGVISVASIAPYDEVESYYRELWRQYNRVIDYVNFQFYSYDASTSASEYVHLYKTAALKYGGGAKVLASFSTAPRVGPVPDTALSALQQLKSSGTLPGIFIFCADDSFSSSSNFQYELQAQSLLAG